MTETKQKRTIKPYVKNKKAKLTISYNPRTADLTLRAPNGAILYTAKVIYLQNPRVNERQINFIIDSGEGE